MYLLKIIFNFIDHTNSFLWSYILWIAIIIAGVYLTIISKGLQFRALYRFQSNLKDIFGEAKSDIKHGIHPFKLYFASVGGMVGLGNIVGISTAIMIGGPGSIFWTIIASILGMLLKYSEIYLGMQYRVKNSNGGYDGGPMYYLQNAFRSKFFAYVAAIMIAIYGVETYQFLIVVDRIEYSLDINRNFIVLGLLCLVIYSAIGGIKRLAMISTMIMPFFMLSYILIALYIIILNINVLPEFILLILKSAFSGQAQIGGFAGSSMILATYLGMSKAVYSGDIGIGYDSIFQSESKISHPKKQATFAIYALLTDALICLLTNTMIGVSGAWHSMNYLEGSDLVAGVLSQYIPHSSLFVTFLLFFAGFTTIIAYLAAGVKCAIFISPKYGKIIYLLYAIFAFTFFCRLSQGKVVIFMELLSGLLVLLNLAGIVALRKKIKF